MNILMPDEYMDLDIVDVDKRGVMGAFIMSRADSTTYAVPFDYSGVLRQLSIHKVTPEMAGYKTVFLQDVHAVWTKHLEGVN